MNSTLIPQISIVIISDLFVVEREKSMIQCLESIEQSTMKHFEVIILSNVVTDTFKSKIEKRFPFVIYYRTPEISPALRLNIGIANANSPLIMQIDDDITLFPDTLEKILKTFAKKPKNVGALALEVYDLRHKHLTLGDNPRFPFYDKQDFATFIGGAVVFRKDIFAKTGYYDGDFFLTAHEHDMMIRINDAGYVVHYIPDIMVNHAHLNSHRKVYYAYFYSFRNHFWMNVKYFSWRYLPVVIVYNLAQLIVTTVEQKSFKVFYTCLWGYVSGILTMHIPLKKRRVASKKTQKKFIRTSLVNAYRHPWLLALLNKIILTE